MKCRRIISGFGWCPANKDFQFFLKPIRCIQIVEFNHKHTKYSDDYPNITDTPLCYFSSERFVFFGAFGVFYRRDQ